MITDRIKAIFQFIEFLHSNIENFKQFDEIKNKLHLLVQERRKLNPQKNFKDKLRFDEVQAEIEDKSKVIEDNIIQPIKAKVSELKIYDLNKPETLWNWNISEINNFKENFNKDIVPEILQQNAKYIEFRKKADSIYFPAFFLQDFDQILKELFDFFKETEQNEFENDLTLKSLVDALSQKTTITEKLNYWLEIKDNFKDIYYKAGAKPLEMPESIYKAHFEPHRTEPEYVYWLMEYEAKDFFENILLTQSEIALAETKEELEYQLNKIVERENLVEQNRKIKKYEYTKTLSNSDAESYDIEYLRIKNNYHSNFDKTKCSTYDGLVNDINIEVFAKHILLKNYLEAKLKELEQPSPVAPLLESSTSTLENNEILFDKEEEKLELVNYFTCDVSTYNELMKFMSDNGFIDSVTKTWNLKDYTKAQLGEFIRMLYPLGYTQSLTIPQRQAIASFFIDRIAESTLKGTPPTNFSISNKQIPYAIEMKSKVNNQTK